jgi:AcrR family transcriptional regulator
VERPAAADAADGTLRPRGERRRRSLVEAGVELLGEVGWSGLTSRAVAERAGAPQGLVHYHFGGVGPLKRAVATSAMAGAVEPVVAALTAGSSWAEGMAAVVRAGQDVSPAEARITAELISAALEDDDVAGLVREVQTELRRRLTAWLTDLGVEQPEGMAVLTAALLDGLALHHLVDDRLPLQEAAEALRVLASD